MAADHPPAVVKDTAVVGDVGDRKPRLLRKHVRAVGHSTGGEGELDAPLPHAADRLADLADLCVSPCGHGVVDVTDNQLNGVLFHF